MTSSPWSRIRPSVGSSKPAIIRSVVVLPEPDGPSIEKNSPSRTSRSMPVDGDQRRRRSRLDRRARAGRTSSLPKTLASPRAGRPGRALRRRRSRGARIRGDASGWVRPIGSSVWVRSGGPRRGHDGRRPHPRGRCRTVRRASRECQAAAGVVARSGAWTPTRAVDSAPCRSRLPLSPVAVWLARCRASPRCDAGPPPADPADLAGHVRRAARGQHHRPRLARSSRRSVDLVAGETVLLHVVNGGLDVHEAVIGDAAVQDAWEAAEAAAAGRRRPGRRRGSASHPTVGGLRIVVASGQRVDVRLDGARRPRPAGGARRRLPHPRPLGRRAWSSRSAGSCSRTPPRERSLRWYASAPLRGSEPAGLEEELE